MKGFSRPFHFGIYPTVPVSVPQLRFNSTNEIVSASKAASPLRNDCTIKNHNLQRQTEAPCELKWLVRLFSLRLFFTSRRVFSAAWHPGSGPTLRRDSVFVRTPGQAAVMWVQTRHMTSPVTARCRTLTLLLLSSGRVWKGQREMRQRKWEGGALSSGVLAQSAVFWHMWIGSEPYTGARFSSSPGFRCLNYCPYLRFVSESNRSDVVTHWWMFQVEKQLTNRSIDCRIRDGHKYLLMFFKQIKRKWTLFETSLSGRTRSDP